MGFQYSFSTYLITIYRYTCVFLLLKLYNKNRLINLLPNKISYLFKIYAFWIFIVILIGLFKSNDYWDYRMLFFDTLLYFMSSISIIIGLNFDYFLRFSRLLFLFLFPVGFFLIPFSLQTNQEVYSRLMVPVSLFIIFIPYLKFRNKVIIFFVIFCSLFTAISFRANVMKIILSLLILLLYYFRTNIKKSFYKFLIFLFFISPFLFFFLGVTNIFNVFENSLDEDKFTVNTANFENESLISDTRTFLYVEVLASMQNNNSFLFGEGATGKYKSDYFSGLLSVHDKYRTSSEVGILNLLLWSGVLGIFLFFLFLFAVSNFGINNSNNTLCKMASVYISCHWFLMFLEEFSYFDLNNLVFWIAIGLVLSKKFRSLSDSEIKSMIINFEVRNTI